MFFGMLMTCQSFKRGWCKPIWYHGYDKWTFQGKLTIEVQLGQWIMYITFNEGNGVVKQLGINRSRNSCGNYKTYHKCTLN